MVSIISFTLAVVDSLTANVTEQGIVNELKQVYLNDTICEY